MASRISLAAAILLASFLPLYAADTPAPAPNSDPTYQQLRNLTLSGEAVSVTNSSLDWKNAMPAHSICTRAPCAS